MALGVIRICGDISCLLFFEQYRIILFDYVGSGQSKINYYDALKYNNLHGYAQDVLEIIEVLERRDIDELLEMMQLNFIGRVSYLSPIVMQNGAKGSDGGVGEELLFP